MTLERLTQSDRDEAVDVLVAAFMDYPVMRFVLGNRDDYPDRIRDLIGYYADLRFSRGWPVIGVRDGNELAGVALISDPEDAPLPASHADIKDRLRRQIGDAAWERMEAFENASKGLEPADPHYFVGMLGVRPGLQGSGFSRVIMDEAYRLSCSDPRSEALCLSTESPDNLPYYRHLGFEITGDANVAGLHTWCLARKTP